MNQYEDIKDLAEIQAPWNKLIEAQETTWEGGFKMLRLRIREGRRITDLELDPDTARSLAALLADWSAKRSGDSG